MENASGIDLNRSWADMSMDEKKGVVADLASKRNDIAIFLLAKAMAMENFSGTFFMNFSSNYINGRAAYESEREKYNGWVIDLEKPLRGQLDFNGLEKKVERKESRAEKEKGMVVQEEVPRPVVHRRKQKQEENLLPLEFTGAVFVPRPNTEEANTNADYEREHVRGRGYPIETHRDFVKRAERGIGTSWSFDPQGKARLLSELFPNGYGVGTSRDVSKLLAWDIGKLFRKQYETSVKRIKAAEGQHH